MLRMRGSHVKIAAEGLQIFAEKFDDDAGNNDVQQNKINLQKYIAANDKHRKNRRHVGDQQKADIIDHGIHIFGRRHAAEYFLHQVNRQPDAAAEGRNHAGSHHFLILLNHGIRIVKTHSQSLFRGPASVN